METMTLKLFDPGMAPLHRAGLAGLWMTLKRFSETKPDLGGLTWEMDDVSVTLHFPDNAAAALDKLLKAAFTVGREGLLGFAAHETHPMGLAERVLLSEAMRNTFLQHNKHNMILGGTEKKELSVAMDENRVFVTYTPFAKKTFAHREMAGSFFTKENRFEHDICIKGWLFPGATERHSGLDGTEISETPGRLLCLLFAPTACLFQRLKHRGADGKNDRRRGYGVVVPHITSLGCYGRSFANYLAAPVERLAADGAGDAGLCALCALRAQDSLDTLGVDGCTVFVMGTVTWSPQQQSRTAIVRLECLDMKMLDYFDRTFRCLPNRRVIYEKPDGPKGKQTITRKFFIASSPVRGLAAENIALGREWFRGFSGMMASKKQGANTAREKGGLAAMIRDKDNWEDPLAQRFVEAMHEAIRSRYGALAAQAAQRGERIPFDREYERMRVGLSRVKNAATLRAEVTDLFARAGLNKTLQGHWQELLPLINGNDWQRARDLALLALVSYSGKGSEELDAAEPQTEDEE
ncbi:MAG: type I-MYXAN CRISPR-associated Cas8a1/Cmx1 [Candidatus Hydrogenedentes bacterium]|nr:type I-MYXAN CRISPR-associated Cas8a1/Cmx1 [Candidatus Hydrogenedentota bacterium]